MADRPVVNPQSRGVAPQTAAKVRSGAGNLASADRETDGLLQGLSQFNAGLLRYTGTEIDRAAAQATAAGQAAGLREGAPSGEAPGEAPNAPERDVPFAFGEHFEAGYRGAINTKHAIGAKQDFLDRLSQDIEKPGFDPKAFSDQYWGEQLAGAQDPDFIEKIAKARIETESLARGQFREIAVKRATAAEHEANSVLIRDAVRADMTPEQIFQAWTGKVRPELQSRGFSRMTGAEQVGMLFEHVQNVSLEAGGVPELFDAFDKFKADNGLTLADMNPQVNARMAEARTRAAEQRSRSIDKATKENVEAVKSRLYDDILTGAAGGYMTPEFLHEMVGPEGLSGAEALSIWNTFASTQKKADEVDEAIAIVNAGKAWTLPEKAQKAALDRITAPHVDALATALANGDTAAAAALAEQLGKAHTPFNANVLNDRLANLFDVQAKSLTPKGPPSPAFVATVEAWKTLPPNLRRAYAKGEAYELYSSYVSATSAGVSPQAAAERAHAAMDPEIQRKARERAKGDPAFRQKVTDMAAKSAAGASGLWGAGFFGFRAENADALAQAWQNEAYSRLLQNPNLTDAEVEAQAKEWFESGHALVRTGLTTSVAIQTPVGKAAGAREALQFAYDEVAKQTRVKDRGEEWSIAFILQNPQQGTYSIHLARHGAPQEQIGTTSLASIQRNYVERNVVTPDDRNVVTALTQKIDAGTITFAELQAARPTLGKLQATGAMTRDLRAKIEAAEQKVFSEAGAKMSSVVPLDKSVDRVAESPPMRATKPDPKLTRSVAEEFLAADPMGRDYRAQARALITLGEAVMLTAYDDPAKGAGKNIGMGYNLKANAKVAAEDLRKAGVPPDEIPKVLAGQRAITPRHAMNLLNVAMPRYEQAARAAIEKAQPGAWESLPPRAKAALIDVAWQAGSPEKFQKATQALLAGDMQGFADNLKVHYKNKQGEMVEDVRRNQLRSAMLGGPARFRALVANHAPATKLASN
jgi:hypothetical protein